MPAMTAVEVEHAPSTAVRARRSTASLAGHPLHPAVVPLPIGLLVGAVLSDVAHLLGGDRFFARASRWLLRGGIASGAAAAILGATDFATIRQARGPIGWAHAGGNAAVLGLSIVSLLLRRGEHDRVPGSAMALTGLAGGLLAVTGWLGGELVFRQRIGVVPQPGDAERL
jgi:uncharacterized membrane protein